MNDSRVGYNHCMLQFSKYCFAAYVQITDIVVADDDGDVVRCHWAKSVPYDECSGVCQMFIGSVLDEV